jgi:hypothetical protein
MIRTLVCVVACLAGGLAADRAAAEEIALFNGKNFDGWTYVLSDANVKMEDVWSVVDGMIVCKGKPSGYLRTKEDYSDYTLTLQWRWAPGSKGGNSGVLVHTSTPGAIGVWPKSIEAQLAAGNAGDIWVIGTTIQIPNADERVMGRRHLNLTDNSEKPAGEWNKYEIIAKGDELTLKVNGDLANHATKCSVTKGAICLQSEGAEVHFRNIKLTRND